MGVAALEVKHAEEIPILDVRKLDEKRGCFDFSF